MKLKDRIGLNQRPAAPAADAETVAVRPAAQGWSSYVASSGSTWFDARGCS